MRKEQKTPEDFLKRGNCACEFSLWEQGVREKAPWYSKSSPLRSATQWIKGLELNCQFLLLWEKEKKKCVERDSKVSLSQGSKGCCLNGKWTAVWIFLTSPINSFSSLTRKRKKEIVFLTLCIGFMKKAMASHSSTLARKIPWMEEPGRLQSMGSLRVRHDWATSLSLFTFMHWRRKRQPTPVFLPGESQGRGAWWAAVYGVAESDATEVT